MKLPACLLFLFISLNCFAQEKPKAIVEVNKMNVVYRGVNNPLTLSMPGTVSFEASAPGLKKVDDYGNYMMSPSSGLTVDIEMRGILPNGEIVSETKTLRILNINKLIGTINGLGCGENCIIKLTKEELKEGEVGVKVVDYLFDLDIRVVSFSIKFTDDSTVRIDGNTINKSGYHFISKLKTDDVIIIQDIRPFIFGTDTSYKLALSQPIKINIVE